MEPVNESTSGSLKWLVLPTLAAEVVLSGIMLGCYALFAALRQDILLGAALGTAAALVNFAAMILGLLRASKKENPLSAQLTSRILFVARMVVLLVVLAVHRYGFHHGIPQGCYGSKRKEWLYQRDRCR